MKLMLAWVLANAVATATGVMTGLGAAIIGMYLKGIVERRSVIGVTP